MNQTEDSGAPKSRHLQEKELQIIRSENIIAYCQRQTTRQHLPLTRDLSKPPNVISPVPSGLPFCPRGLTNKPNMGLSIAFSAASVCTNVGVLLNPDMTPSLVFGGPRPTKEKFKN